MTIDQPGRDIGFRTPDADQLLREALEGISVGLEHCSCPTRYHALWSALKAAGVNHGMYTEAPVLTRLLAPPLHAGSHALVAGCADASALQLLHACAGGQPLHYTVADQCEAPLQRVRRYAAAHGIEVETLHADLAQLAPPAAPRPPWSVVFIHYTLSFMDAALRRRVRRALAAGLAPAGSIVCSVKFGPGARRRSPQQWIDAMRPRLAAVLHDHPEALAAVERHLPDYADSRSERRVQQPDLQALQADFAAAGLVIRALHDTRRGAWSASPANPTQEAQTSLILLAGHAA